MINKNYLKLEKNYLFTEIALRTEEFQKSHPDIEVLKLGIGDVTRPLEVKTADAIINAVEELKHKETFRGYGPELGHDFAKQAVINYYKKQGIDIRANEITIGDGIGSDLANITDIFAYGENRALVTDPVYPLYNASSLMNGYDILYLHCTKENNFVPLPPDNEHVDIIFLCSPNNPTGATFTKEQLQAWVDYANREGAVILYDNAYERFISDPNCPHSIFAIKEARTCAIEFNSLSKTAGFTCVRSGYTIVPEELVRDGVQLLRLWQQRQTTKYNGAPYMTQRGLAAALSDECLAGADKNIEYYKENGKIITAVLDKKGIFYSGGVNSPYIWFECPHKMKSWEMFDYLLNKIHVVGTPGVGFGSCGEHYFRFSTFNTHEITQKAMERFEKLF